MSEDMLKSLEQARKTLAMIIASLDTIVKPKAKLVDIAEHIENEISSHGCMWAFPVNTCIGSIAAHYTPIAGEDSTLPEDEIIKIDFGVAVNGYILDKAISFYFGDDEKKKSLIEVANEAVDLAISKIGPGVQFMDIAAEIHDFVKSRGFKVIKNLHGHKLEKWKLHTDVEIPVHPEIKQHGVFIEGETYAIEVFVTDGEGLVETIDDLRIYSLPNFLIDLERFKLPIHLRAARDIFNWAWRNRKTLPFSIRHLQKTFDEPTIKIGLAVLGQYGLIVNYHVLKEKQGTVAQAEETILVKKDGVDILTRP